MTNKIKFICLIVFIVSHSFLSCNNNKKQTEITSDTVAKPIPKKAAQHSVDAIKTKGTINSKTKYIDKTIYLGFQGFDGSLQPKPDTFRISKKAFLKYKNADSSLKIVYDPSKISIHKLSYTIKTAKGKTRHSLDSISKNNVGGYSNWQPYIGFYAPLKLFIIKSRAEGEFGFSKIDFIDSLNNKFYELTSNSDGEGSLPIFSKNRKFMAFFTEEDETEFPESVINITKIDQGPYENLYKNYAAFNSITWLIEDIVWIDNYSLAIKAQSIIDVNWRNKPNKYIYFKYIIPKSPVVIKFN